MLKTLLQVPTRAMYEGNVEYTSNYILVMIYDTELKRRVRYNDNNWPAASTKDDTELHSPNGRDGFKSYREMMSFVKSKFKNLREFKVHPGCQVYDDPHGVHGFKIVWADER